MPIGVSAGETRDRIRIHYHPCTGERVTGLTVGYSEDIVIDETEDEVHWKVTSPTGVSETTFSVGTTPPGFTEEVPLVDGSVSESFFVAVDTTQRRLLGGFEVASLRTHQIRAEGRMWTPEEFRQFALRECSAQ